MTTHAPKAGFVLRHNNGRHWFEIQNPREFMELVGADLVAAFLKCYRGVDQIKNIEAFMKFEADHVRDQSLASVRMGPALGLLMISTLYEIGAALKELEGHRLDLKVSNREELACLIEIRKAWHKESNASIYRNQLGFHLGDKEIFRKGLSTKVEEAGENLEFSCGDGSRSHDWVHTLAFDVALAGAGITDDSVEEILSRAADTHPEFPDLLDRVWIDVLTTAGVEVFKEESYPDPPGSV